MQPNQNKGLLPIKGRFGELFLMYDCMTPELMKIWKAAAKWLWINVLGSYTLKFLCLHIPSVPAGEALMNFLTPKASTLADVPAALLKSSFSRQLT